MVYRFRIISNEVEGFVREFEIKGVQTFYDFHLAIQKNLEYDNAQIASFQITDQSWIMVKELTLFDLDEDNLSLAPMDVATIDEFVTDPKQRILYLFDMFNDRALFIELVGKFKETETKNFPACILEKGEPPVQIKVDGGSSSNIFGDAMSDFEGINSYEDDTVVE
ncbi:IS1096 element passenger TnpR family protein [Williamwhitmania taraxaci]|uniref:PRiA4b ORF-3-like protein n=1 Tax=Williamwhitmania taraxaci TaxID=1640674 RepID=A0A1G6GHY4_9BACT|nr:hypothetical protein [Williamwhitmania taraxaci]SDB81632.1 pRiA4b ORF-3-like protein [Williamwhitmania taraxaci]